MNPTPIHPPTDSAGNARSPLHLRCPDINADLFPNGPGGKGAPAGVVGNPRALLADVQRVDKALREAIAEGEEVWLSVPPDSRLTKKLGWRESPPEPLRVYLDRDELTVTIAPPASEEPYRLAVSSGLAAYGEAAFEVRPMALVGTNQSFVADVFPSARPGEDFILDQAGMGTLAVPADPYFPDPDRSLSARRVDAADAALRRVLRDGGDVWFTALDGAGSVYPNPQAGVERRVVLDGQDVLRAADTREQVGTIATAIGYSSFRVQVPVPVAAADLGTAPEPFGEVLRCRDGTAMNVAAASREGEVDVGFLRDAEDQPMLTPPGWHIYAPGAPTPFADAVYRRVPATLVREFAALHAGCETLPECVMTPQAAAAVFTPAPVTAPAGERRTIAGVELEAVRFENVRNEGFHWRAKVVQTGYVYEAGVFKGESRPKMWESIEHMVRLIGTERFAREALAAGQESQVGPSEEITARLQGGETHDPEDEPEPESAGLSM